MRLTRTWLVNRTTKHPKKKKLTHPPTKPKRLLNPYQRKKNNQTHAPRFNISLPIQHASRFLAEPNYLPLFTSRLTSSYTYFPRSPWPSDQLSRALGIESVFLVDAVARVNERGDVIIRTLQRTHTHTHFFRIPARISDSCRTRKRRGKGGPRAIES